MEMITAKKAYDLAHKRDIHEIAGELVKTLGAPLVSGLTGVKDLKAPYGWAKPQGHRPRIDTERRLRLAYRIWLQVSREDDNIGRAWFVGGNPMLEEDTPLTAIREGRDKEVVAAATNFIEAA